jgi:hypothetical protein
MVAPSAPIPTSAGDTDAPPPAIAGTTKDPEAERLALVFRHPDCTYFWHGGFKFIRLMNHHRMGAFPGSPLTFHAALVVRKMLAFDITT